jgi:hypothetical protein
LPLLLPSFPTHQISLFSVNTVSATFRSSFSCRSNALVFSISLVFDIRFAKVVRREGFLFGADFAFHCFPAVRQRFRRY